MCEAPRMREVPWMRDLTEVRRAGRTRATARLVENHVQSSVARRRTLAPHEVVDQLARDAELGRDPRQLVGSEPVGVGDLGRIRDDVAPGPARGEPDHQRARERPGLAAEVAYVADRDPGLL